MLLAPLAVAAWLACSTSAQAQSSAEAPPRPAAGDTSSSTLAPISVTGTASPAASVSGFGSRPLIESPLQASVYTESQLQDSGVRRLADLSRLDPAVSDSYNSEGYWDQLSIRGYALDQRYNYRRDGLPINAQTSIPLDNKSRLEVLKGISGIQSGTSAPGGLANYVVKRPTEAPIRSVLVEWQERNAWLGAVDIGQRFGANNAFGLRVNAATEKLAPQIRDMDGHRNLLAVAADWRITPSTLIEAEIETSQRTQRSQPGFSLLGNAVPPPGDPRINLNNQPWSQPNDMNANTGSLRLRQQLTSDWRLNAHMASQQLEANDRLAYPFGCAAEGNFDRYCSDGSFDYYDFRSDGERRRMDAADLSLTGQLKTGSTSHELTAGVLRSNLRERYNAYANNFVAEPGNVNGTAVTTPNAAQNFANVNRDERSTEFYLRDVIAWTGRFSTWMGARHTRIDRASVATDGSGSTSYRQSFTTPWLAATYAFMPSQIVYASWGRGVESRVAPTLVQFANAGLALPALKSRQLELGIKGAAGQLEWNVAWFNISRPTWNDSIAAVAGVACSADPGTCLSGPDGSDKHRGIEASLAYEGATWGLRGGVQALHARLEGSSTPTTNGLRPVNVPELTVKLQGRYNVGALPGLSLLAGMTHESDRMALTDNTLGIPALTYFDLSAKYEQVVSGTRLTWRAGIENAFDKRAWRESPTQFGHVYLYPLAPRSMRVSLQAAF